MQRLHEEREPDAKATNPQQIRADMLVSATVDGDESHLSRSQTLSSRCVAKINNLRRAIHVEPILFFFMFGTSLLWPTIQALIYRKVCLKKFNQSICDNLSNSSYKDEENMVQTDAAHWFLLENICFEIPSIIFTFFYGSLGDNVSRKLTLILPAVGQIFSAANYIVNAMYIDLHVGYILIGPLFSGIFGGWVTCNMASFSYLSDVTPEKNRTFRIAIAEAIISTSLASSFFFGGMILDHTSFPFVFSLGLTMFIFAILYTVFRIRDTDQGRRRRGIPNCGEVCKATMAPKQIKDTLGCVFRKREKNGRSHVLVSMAVLVTTIISSIAGLSLFYLYVRKQPLSWSQGLYGRFVGYALVTGAIGQITVVPFFRKVMGMRETFIFFVGTISGSLSLAMMSISTYTWMVFTVPLVGFVGDARPVILRSLLSRMVEKHELGRMFATFGALQSLSTLIGNVIYNNIYPLTLSFWPGFSFMLGGLLGIVPFSLIAWLHVDLKRWGLYHYTTLDHAGTNAEGDEVLRGNAGVFAVGEAYRQFVNDEGENAESNNHDNASNKRLKALVPLDETQEMGDMDESAEGKAQLTIRQ